MTTDYSIQLPISHFDRNIYSSTIMLLWLFFQKIKLLVLAKTLLITPLSLKEALPP